MGFLTVFVVEKLLATTDGKDKVMKIMQYLAKILMIARVNGGDLGVSGSAWDRLTAFVGNVSVARKVIRLGHGISSITDLFTFCTAASSTTDLQTPLRRLMSTKTSANDRAELLADVAVPVLGLVNDSLDDLICLAKITNSSNKLRIKGLTTWSDRVWFLSILLDLRAAWMASSTTRRRIADIQFCHSSAIENLDSLSLSPHTLSNDAKTTEIHAMQQKLQSLHQKLKMQSLSTTKLLIDLIFCSYDVFGMEARGVSGDVQVVSGFVAGLIGLYKICKKHQ